MSNKELAMVNKAGGFSVEINGISMILAGISNQLEPGTNDSLTMSALYDAIYAIRQHLERIARDLEHIGE